MNAGSGGNGTTPSAPASTNWRASRTAAAVWLTVTPDSSVHAPAITDLQRLTISICSSISSELDSLAAMFIAIARGRPAATCAM